MPGAPISGRRRELALAVVAALAVIAASARAARADDAGEPLVLRIATLAPDGSAWGREFKAFARDVESATDGEVRVKLYLGGVAGDELEVADRIRKGQLDGTISGGMLCSQVAPSMRVLRVPGLLQSRDESSHVITQLMPALRDEASDAGFMLLATAGLGPSVVFSRKPIRSMDDLRALRLWRWEHDEIVIAANRAMGLTIVPMRIDAAAEALDEDEIDGVYAVPGATLAFQWFAQVQYFADLRGGYLTGCFLMTNNSFDRVPGRHQQALFTAAAKLGVRIDEVGARQDEALLGGVFERQGLKKIAIARSFRAEFFQAARDARDDLIDGGFVSRELLDQVQQLLADFRAEHH